MTPTKNADTISGRAASLDMTGGAFREAGHRLVDQIAAWLETMPDGPVMVSWYQVAPLTALQENGGFSVMTVPVGAAGTGTPVAGRLTVKAVLALQAPRPLAGAEARTVQV